MKWTHMSEKLKSGVEVEAAESEAEIKRKEAQEKLKSLMRKLVFAHQAAKIFGEGAKRDKGNSSLLSPVSYPQKLPVGFMARKVYKRTKK